MSWMGKLRLKPHLHIVGCLTLRVPPLTRFFLLTDTETRAADRINALLARA